ncbi:hypothetical protein D3C73_992170 [compost metagenome]
MIGILQALGDHHIAEETGEDRLVHRIKLNQINPDPYETLGPFQNTLLTITNRATTNNVHRQEGCPPKLPSLQESNRLAAVRFRFHDNILQGGP